MDLGILIVDDDMLLVEKLEKMINWEALGIQMVFTAKNIRQAQKCLEEYPIHILLSDIEMPQGSGLELVEWAKARLPSLECIFLSSYAYFAYAQKALQLGCKNYLLKPVSNRELEEVLHKTVEKIRENDNREWQQENEDYTRFWEKYMLSSMKDNMILEEAQKKGLYTAQDQIMLEIIKILPDSEHKKKKDGILFRFIINNIVTELFGEKGQCLNAIVQLSDFEWILIFCENNIQLETLTEATKELKDCLEKRTHLKTCVYFGYKTSISGLNEHRQNLQQMRMEAVPDKEGLLFEETWIKKLPAEQKHPWELWEKEMNESRDFQAIGRKMLEYLECCWKESRVTINDMERFRRELMQMIYKYLNRQNTLITRIFDNEEFDIYFDNAKVSQDGMEAFICYLFERLDGNRRMDNRQEAVVEQIKTYIDHNMKEELSRKVLAQHIFLSEDYISKIFVTVMGMSISTYVMQRRIEKAKEYLQYTDMTVSKVAMEVGYSNFSYFSKNFRDIVGCTPNEFRRK